MTQPKKEKWREFWLVAHHTDPERPCWIFETSIESGIHAIEHAAYLEQQAMLDEFSLTLEQIIEEEIDTSTDGGMEFIKQLLTKLRERKG